MACELVVHAAGVFIYNLAHNKAQVELDLRDAFNFVRWDGITGAVHWFFSSSVLLSISSASHHRLCFCVSIKSKSAKAR